MPLVNAFSKAVVRDFSIEELKEAARLMRGYDLVALCAAGSGHTGGTLSMMEIVAALYLKVALHDPNNPEWPLRDRIIWSAGHKAPALYLGLAFAGYFPIEDVVTLRKLYSPFQGHPHRLKLPGVEVSSGSLGQGLSIAVGMALAGKLDKEEHSVFCIMGDGEQQEGNIWEAAMEASHYKLDNLVGIIDRNRLQIDGWVKDVMNVEPLADRYRSFGWEVIEIDGHDMPQVVDALEKAKSAPVAGKPTLILASTVKGKGVSFMENVAGWHGKAPNYDEMVKGIDELGLKNSIAYDALLEKAKEYQSEVEATLAAKMPDFPAKYWWNSDSSMKVKMEPTRKGFGQSLKNNGDDERVVCLGLDISSSITISEFYASHPERKQRWISMGIAEQSATAAAAGLAREGKLPVLRHLRDLRGRSQPRSDSCVDLLRQFQRADRGRSRRCVGWSRRRHPSGAGRSFRHVRTAKHVGGGAVRCIETRKATDYLLLEHVGPKYIRFAREATPMVTREDTPFVFGVANVSRLRRQAPNMVDAFETVLATGYENEQEDLSIIACGPMVPEAMRAAWILKNEFDYETRVINLHTMKPIDEETVVRAAKETGVIVTAEEHQIGALAWRVSGILTERPELYGVPVITGAIGVKDRFGDSGAPWELIREFEVSAEHIAQKAVELLALARAKQEEERLAMSH